MLFVFLRSITATSLRLAQERVKQLETRMIHWTRQVRVVARPPEGGPQRASPLDELAFWRARLSDLSSICDQLSSPGVRPGPLSTSPSSARACIERGLSAPLRHANDGGQHECAVTQWACSC